MDKDSGFMADVSYQQASNYFNFQSNYQQPPPPQPKPYVSKNYDHYEQPKQMAKKVYRDPVDYAPAYPAATKPMIKKKPTTTTPAPVYYEEPVVQEVEWTTKEDVNNKQVAKSFLFSSVR